MHCIFLGSAFLPSKNIYLHKTEKLKSMRILLSHEVDNFISGGLSELYGKSALLKSLHGAKTLPMKGGNQEQVSSRGSDLQKGEGGKQSLPSTPLLPTH